ncbi:hypothetical protein F5X99DRAFT_368797 [Biscogniauxia marginata]|nr:hypothetical protein F5X99DRAFT_368797 [Biscogniauxia marginata]
MASFESAKNLSFGVELKFLIPCLGPEDHDYNMLDDPPILRAEAKDNESELWETVYDIVADTIITRAAQLAITRQRIDDNSYEERDYWETHWIVKKSNSAEPSREDPRYDGYKWVPVELNSPKLAWVDTKSLSMVDDVIKSLKERCRIVTNHTCEVHVHVGRRDNQELSLPTLKRLATLSWLGESVLRAVKDPKSPNFNHTYTWSSPLTQHSRLATVLNSTTIPMQISAIRPSCCDESLAAILRAVKLQDPRDLYALREIWSSSSYVDLARMLSGPGAQYRRLGFNFSAFGEERKGEQGKPKTIECRFLEGHMKSIMVIGWVMIFCTMVEVTLNGHQPDSRFEMAIYHLLQKGDDVALDLAFQTLCQDLQVPEVYCAPFVAKIRQYRGRTGRGCFGQESLWIEK